jgi:L-ornithine Nalpha-acyltransferase
MPILQNGRYEVRLAANAADLVLAMRLRHLVFRAAHARQSPDMADCDAFDAQCRHILVLDRASGTLVCCFRLLILPDGTAIRQSYAAQFYDLRGLSRYGRPMLEMGRFCVHPEWRDPDILRLAWAALALIVDETGAGMLFGCSSFQGTDAARHADAFAMLNDSHLAPKRWLPRVKAPRVFRFSAKLASDPTHRLRALKGMPPLLRSYLGMGGWVSDHAVVDRDLNTMHVFTGLEISLIPPARANALRAVAGQA